MSLVQNERAKPSATYLNGLAIAVFAVGGLAPLVSIFNSPTPPPLFGAATIAVICIAASVTPHFVASGILGQLEP